MSPDPTSPPTATTLTPPHAKSAASAAGRVAPVWFALATWFGAGLAPRAPGTVGSLASLVLWAPLVLGGSSWWARLLVVVAVFAFGVVAAQRVVDVRGEDPQVVVIDEVAGMGVALLLAPPTVWSLIAGFVLFRIFDIAKPWPVSWADRRVGGGVGVMLDDVLAGVYALLVFLLGWGGLGLLLPDVTLAPGLPRMVP
jgi:phosphatidylglycerophosphatase A